jgi:opacity protein-like surface antigen
MKKILAGTALAVACLTPLASAKAVEVIPGVPFCTNSLALNFCGSVEVTVVDHGTYSTVQFTVYNTSSVSATQAAVFTAIGLEGVSGITGTESISNLSVMMGTTSFGGWDVDINKSLGGGVNVDILASTTAGINWGISSECSGAQNLIYTCGTNAVIISFDVTPGFVLGGGDVFVKAQNARGGGLSGECIIGTDCSSTNVPEPASIILVGTGLMALGRRASRWRRRNQTA